MRKIDTALITQKVKELFIKANYTLPVSIENAIHCYKHCESNEMAKEILGSLEKNIVSAKEINVPICQDTGMAVVFLEIGREIALEGEPLEDAVNEGVRLAYKEGYLRKSIVKDPLFERINTDDNTPAIIYTRIVSGDRIKIVAAPKGFGSENMSRCHMFTPSATRQDIVDFVLECVKAAGGNPCPPIVVGVGIGGTFEYSAYLAKKALCRDINIRNKNENYRILEDELLGLINKTDIGPQGFGGDCTALGVNIEYFPTHIAGLPVSVNMGCHVTRHEECVI